jgi:hypothetical protein
MLGASATLMKPASVSVTVDGAAGAGVEDVFTAGAQAEPAIRPSSVMVVVRFIGKLLIRSREAVIEQTSPEARSQSR